MNNTCSSYVSINAGARCLLALAGLLWCNVLIIRAADYYVRAPGTCTNTIEQSPFSSWETAATQIQWAVDVAMTNLPATVWVTSGVYVITNQIMITNSVTVKSMHGWTNTFVYADWPAYTTRVFYVVNTGVVDGFTISNGHHVISGAYAGGGGLYLASSSVVQNCRITHNLCTNAYNAFTGGGGVYATRAEIRNCIIVNNRVRITGALPADPNAFGGGGAIIVDGTISDSTVSTNHLTDTWGNGGGLYLTNSRAYNCTLNVNDTVYKGGGICALGASIITNCGIAWNSANAGGGVKIGTPGGSPSEQAKVWYSVISNNTAQGDSGMVSGGGGIMTHKNVDIANCTIINNTGRGFPGGGMHINGGSVFISNCVVVGNKRINDAGAGGAGIYADGINYSIYIDKCRISNNICTVGLGGGGVVLVGDGVGSYGVRIRNSLICNNTNTSAAGTGGGVLSTNIRSSSFGLQNCTIAGNYSTNEGGGLALSAANNYVVDCIMAGNSSSSGNYPNVYFRDNGNLNRSNLYYNCIVTADPDLFAANQGNITNEPVFADADWRLTPGSPCVNAGTNLSWTTNATASDLDGGPRIRYGTVDMGAYEMLYEGTIFRFP